MAERTEQRRRRDASGPSGGGGWPSRWARAVVVSIGLAPGVGSSVVSPLPFDPNGGAGGAPPAATRTPTPRPAPTATPTGWESWDEDWYEWEGDAGDDGPGWVVTPPPTLATPRPRG